MQKMMAHLDICIVLDNIGFGLAKKLSISLEIAASHVFMPCAQISYHQNQPVTCVHGNGS